MTMLTKEQILGAQDRERKAVDVPEWGGTVWVAVLSGTDREAFEEMAGEKHGVGQFRARLVALAVVDETGARLFTEADVPALAAKSFKALHRVFTAALALNVIGQDAEDAMLGNSAAAPAAGPTSPSLSA